MINLLQKTLHNVSLQWRIFFFYLFFGFAPLLIILALSVAAYNRSIESITEAQMTAMVKKVADQTTTLCYETYRKLDLLANFPYVQLSFLEFPRGRQLDTIREKLELFRINAGGLHRLTLYANDGRVVVSTPATRPLQLRYLPRVEFGSLPLGQDYFHLEPAAGDGRHLVLFRRVYDFQDQSRAVGLLAAEIPLTELVGFIDNLAIGPGMEKAVVDQAGKPLFQEQKPWPGEEKPGGGTRRYSAPIRLLDWQVVVSIPEAILFRDVNRLIARSLVFTLVVVVFAVGASLLFSRRVTRPLEEIIAGAKQFAAGNLDYRIKVKTGRELQRLADEFNLMASRLEERQAELVQANKLASLGLLAAGIAHEIKNPLAGIKTSAQVLKKLLGDGGAWSLENQPPGGEGDGSKGLGPEVQNDMQELARGIAEEVDRLDQTVRDLLEFARPRPSAMVPCELSTIVQRALKLMQTELRRKQVRVATEVSPVMVRVDPDQMTQVLLNLLVNSLAAVEPGKGRIEVRTVAGDDGMVELQVADNGHGIPAEMLGRIFDPFFSLSKKGTGLGLSIVFSLLNQNKVKFDVASRENEGTTFKLIFDQDQRGEENGGDRHR